MGQSGSGRTAVLESVDRMCEQLLQGDNVVGVLHEYLIMTDMNEYEEEVTSKKIMATLDKLPDRKIVALEMNLAMWKDSESKDIRKLTEWLTERLEMVRNGQWELNKFKATWAKAILNILKRVDEADIFDKIILINIIEQVNDL